MQPDPKSPLVTLTHYEVYSAAKKMVVKLGKTKFGRISVRKLQRSLGLTPTQLIKIAEHHPKTFRVEPHGKYTWILLV